MVTLWLALMQGTEEEEEKMAKRNHFGALALVAVEMLVLMLTLVEPAQATFPGQNGKIAYSIDVPSGHSAYEIWIRNTDGTLDNAAINSPQDYLVRARGR